jgi:hypothetical protein
MPFSALYWLWFNECEGAFARLKHASNSVTIQLLLKGAIAETSKNLDFKPAFY